ncbi:DNA-binding protein [Rhodopseudomonas pseudopalustris]|uniref:DNA binding domain-containing protein, excisionase family n=1 Tax=Rhodopseudomonas pseudopalustris TaxID=1513892 RepID=A0A1H8VX37_9BRAD|nr:DNA-binding protein [Rhodopseudomonas pseudopalustris]SEP19961.1 hypothetical protein SAMN05444123_11012 [Rhodopseudomonas pseudopalustris]
MDSAVRDALIKDLTVSVETAGKAFGIGRNAAYAACANLQIPSVRIGGRIVVPTAPLRKMLGIDVGAQ